MSHEPELVAVVVPGYSSMIEEATFPLPLWPMERWDARDCGFERLVGDTTLILLHQMMREHQTYCRLFLRLSVCHVHSSKERLDSGIGVRDKDGSWVTPHFKTREIRSSSACRSEPDHTHHLTFFILPLDKFGHVNMGGC